MSLPDLQRTVGRIEGKLDTFIQQMAIQDKRTTDLEVRTRKVENKLHWWSGAAVIIGSLIGYTARNGGHPG